MKCLRITFEPFKFTDGDTLATIGPLVVECQERPKDEICIYSSGARNIGPGESITLKLRIAGIETVDSDAANDSRT